MAAVCSFYPGYTLASLREVTVRELNVLVERMNDELEKANGR